MKALLKKVYRFTLKLVPRNRLGDKFVAYLNFVRFHKRLPANHMLNDHLFRIKTSDEILDVLRQYTSDKEFVKNYIKDTVGDELNVKTISILRSADEILEYEFREGEVVKPTHASGRVHFVKDINFDKSKLIEWLSLNYYDVSREANYKYLTPKIIVEEPIFGRHDVDDVKFFCVHGKVKVIQWDFDRHVNHTRLLYDRNWKSLDASIGYPKSDKTKSKPSTLNEMINVAEMLAKPFSLVRIDLFFDEETEKYYVGEITHCHGSSNESFDSKDSEVRVTKTLFDS